MAKKWITRKLIIAGIFSFVAVFVLRIVYTAYLGPYVMNQCVGSQIFCPGVGCVSGRDKCIPGYTGGPDAIFSRETFKQWPGAGVRAEPPVYDIAKESFVNKTCPDGTRSDGPCLLEPPSF